MDPYDKLKKVVRIEYAHWDNCKDDEEVRMRHYMCMTTYFVKTLNIFPMQDQIVEEENTIVVLRYDVVANLSLPLID